MSNRELKAIIIHKCKYARPLFQKTIKKFSADYCDQHLKCLMKIIEFGGSRHYADVSAHIVSIHHCIYDCPYAKEMNLNIKIKEDIGSWL